MYFLLYIEYIKNKFDLYEEGIDFGVKNIVPAVPESNKVKGISMRTLSCSGFSTDVWKPPSVSQLLQVAVWKAIEE